MWRNALKDIALKQQKSFSKQHLVPLQDELLTQTSQLRNGQPSIFAIQVWHIAYCITCTTKLINTTSRLVRAHFDFLHFMCSNTMIFAVLNDIWRLYTDKFFTLMMRISRIYTTVPPGDRNTKVWCRVMSPLSNLMSIRSGVFDPRGSENRGFPLTRLVALTTVLHYRVDCD